MFKNVVKFQNKRQKIIKNNKNKRKNTNLERVKHNFIKFIAAKIFSIKLKKNYFNINHPNKLQLDIKKTHCYNVL